MNPSDSLTTPMTTQNTAEVAESVTPAPEAFPTWAQLQRMSDEAAHEAARRRHLLARVHDELTEHTDFWVSHIPGAFGRSLRAAYYRKRLKHLGPRAFISPGFEVLGAERIHIGHDFFALRNCFLSAADGGTIEIGNVLSCAKNVVVNAGSHGVIRIGNGVGLGFNCVLRSSAHRYEDAARPFKGQGHKPGTIIIEDDVWVTANVTILPDTYLERGCVVCAGSVVGGRVKAYSIVAGNPARVIGKRGA